jgi:M6 family metalloprotease-like protein
VPVDYRDRKHEPSHSAERLVNVINSPDLPGSTYRLYQEMSYGQLHPHGAVPSAARASADFSVTWSSPHRRASGFAFSQPAPKGACYGATIGPLSGTPVYNERIADGWYQLPGDTAYYGGDLISFANVGVGNPGFIDNACGPIAKAVYDSALIADPEIDYSDYDTDKDGVVDFYMMVFAGLGGNGASQLSVPPYDNIWPHSSSLESYFKDPETGLLGYVSDDQLKDHQGRPLYYTNASRGAMTTTPTDYPVFVRVGPYNVNPEAAIEKASVISHEYGHSLGLPDYYSSGTARRTYGDWNLMATDKSQHMDVNAKQELGWLIPRVLQLGQTAVSGWRDSKVNTHRIDWVQPDGTPYTLTGPRVNNGEAYVARLPGRQIITPEKVANGASPSHVWWSRSGNDFGCPPTAGNNLDIELPELASVPAGTPVTLTFKSNWDIEWDYDYGFVLTKYIDVDPQGNARDTDYVSHASQKNFSTPAQFNPNTVGCLEKYGNGLTGTTASYVSGTFAVDRNPAENLYPQEDLQGNPVGFVEDSYDLSRLAGRVGAVLRFTYATDPGLARPGWFIDDIRVTAGNQVIYESNFENGADEARIYNGGCKEGLQVAQQCTAGWQYVSSAAKAEQDHAYYLEMRDRSGFDFASKDQNDRAPLAFIPGLLLVYTDEAAGYGNTGELGDDSPNQTPLDSEPQIGSQTPNVNDAAFTAAAGKNRFSDSVNEAQPEGWVDNYKDAHDPEANAKYADTNWHFDFNCLTLQVLGMSGDGLGPDDIGPDGANTDLRGDVSFTLGSGCAAYDYGVGPETNGKPTAVIQLKPSRGAVRVNQRVRFDGSASYDDRDPSSKLTYAWDFQGDGTVDATTREATHRYPTVGSYPATLKVTDTGGLSDTETVVVTVSRGDDDD